MKTPEEILREMREAGNEPQGYGEHAVTCDDVFRWADGIEASMQWPVAEVYESADSVCGERGTEIDWIGSRRCDPGTKLYALPPDAATVIRLEVEHSRMLVEEIERLSVAFRLMANQKLPHEMNSEDREFADWQHAYTACVLIARTALAKESAPREKNQINTRYPLASGLWSDASNWNDYVTENSTQKGLVEKASLERRIGWLRNALLWVRYECADDLSEAAKKFIDNTLAKEEDV
jgi:hypothetical protein